MKKQWILLVISILCMGLFTACASNADTMPSPSPTVSASPMVTPAVTVSVSPTVSAAPTAEAGVNTVEDALRVSDRVAEEAEKLSELSSAQAVVGGTIALVGIAYDAQYQGGLTDRLVDMVDARVQAVDKSITAVHVTDDEAIVKEIKALRDKLEKKELTFSQLQTQMLDISGKITSGDGGQTSAQPQATPAGTGA